MRQFLTVSDVAHEMGVTPDTVRYWTRTGGLKATRTRSGVRLIDPVDLTLFRKQREQRRRNAAETDNGLIQPGS